MNLDSRLREYFADLHQTARRGDAREESFYSLVANLITDYAHANGHKDLHVTAQPRPTEAGNPDFRVWDGKFQVVGYIEAKPPGSDLHSVADSEQLRRYRNTFPNLLLTDFCTFWLFRDGELTERVQIGRPFVLTTLEAPPPPENVTEAGHLLTHFLGFSLPRSFDAPTLARELARRTRFLRRIVLAQLESEEKAKSGHLRGFFHAFRRFLIANLKQKQFADLYAQTTTYGLFAARTRAADGFDRRSAVRHIPRTIGVLHDVFEFLSWGELPEELAWIVDDIAQVLALADVNQILDRYYREGKGADPIVHFYETFLEEYDPAERERRGVYYTPEPVVGYIVRSLHEIVQGEFSLKEGLASKGLTLLDPAAGTMTFVARAVEEAVGAFVKRYGEGGREAFLRDQVLPNFYGFELMMAPYAVGHLKMGFYLDELGHRLGAEERFQLYLTNTLEMEKTEQSDLPGMAALAEEAEHAYQVKKQTPILVILGNPPYSGHSANTGEWIRGLIEDYKKPAPELNRPGQAKWLQDDYVKFLRFAEWKIAQAGQGVLGMITNHSWLDNPTFRGMRWHLMQTFDEIRVLDLHGNSLKKEKAPSGETDQNVFDIRQGVAISFFLKRPKDVRGNRDALEAKDTAETVPTREPSTVHHAELWGTRGEKYSWLETHDVNTTKWQEVKPQARFFLFTPVNRSAKELYDRFVPVPLIFSPNGRPAPGIVTTQDEFAISWTPEEAIHKVRLLLGTASEADAREIFTLCSQSQWSYDRAKRELADSAWEEEVVPILYRPFDVRWTVYNRNVAVHRRERVMQHMLEGDNLALITTRQHKRDFGAFCTRHIGTHKTVAVYDINYYFPLYVYPTEDRKELLRGTRAPNLHSGIVEELASALGRVVTPEEFFGYVYAILYTPTYTSTYDDFLRIDFPQVPITKKEDLFREIAACGRRLMSLHILEADEVDALSARFHGRGNNRVGQKGTAGLGYDPDREMIAINPDQYFAPVPEELWEYRIGGYQVLHKWLKDRANRTLTSDEIRIYCQVVTALARTVEIQMQLDEIYPGVEQDLLKLSLEVKR